MPTERRSPWFNARRDPPVNGGDDAQYEHRCKWINRNRPQRTDREDVMLAGRMCPDCQWRGLLREDGGKA